jgi:hypothetical protein
MKKTQYSPAEEQQLMAQLWSPMIADDPLAFVMFAFPWGEKGTPLARFQGPRRWQRKVLRRIAQHVAEGKVIDLPKLLRIARASGRGIGKSALVAWLVLWFLTTRIGATVIISANTETQLRKITWAEVSKWVTMAIHAHWWEVSGITLRPANWLADLVERDLQKGTGYWSAEGKLWSEENPDAYAGAHNHDGMMVIFDEASGIPDSIWSVANGFFTEPIPNRIWLAFSQGRRNSGYFFEIFNKKRDLWDNDQIDARTVEGTDPQVYQEIIDEYGEDSDEARVEVYGQFPNDDGVTFISNTLVESAAKRKIEEDPTAPITIGVDPAGTGTDTFTIYIRQGLKTLGIRRFKLTDSEVGTMEGVGHVIDAINDFSPDMTTIDETGMGGPIGDRLREQRYKVRGVNFSWKSKKPQRWGNKRAEMWGEMKKWLERGQIPDDKRLKTDLTAPGKKPDSKGVMFLESKKDMKARGLASPDSADALALTFAFPVANRGYNGQASTAKRDGYVPVAAPTSWMGN